MSDGDSELDKAKEKLAALRCEEKYLKKQRGSLDGALEELFAIADEPDPLIFGTDNEWKKENDKKRGESKACSIQ